MPIDDEEWRSGRTSDTTEQQIVEFLRNNPHQAFTAIEIAQALNRIPQPADSEDFADLLIKGVAGGVATIAIKNSLENLVKEGQVEVRTIKEAAGEEEYYRISQGGN